MDIIWFLKRYCTPRRPFCYILTFTINSTILNSPEPLTYPTQMPQMTPILSLLTNFLVGGTVVATVSAFANYLSPLAGAIWWSFPLSILPTVYFLRAHGKSNHYVSSFLLSTTFAIVLLVATTLILSYYFGQLSPNDPGWWVVVLKTVGWWVVMSGVFYGVVKWGGLEGWFV